MPRSLHLLAACALTLILCLSGRSQDSPSLGDLARQAQKDKSNTPAAKKVITNEDLPSGSGLGPSGLAGGPAGGAARAVLPGAPVQTAAAASPSDELARMESLLSQLDSLDRATLAKNVLQGADADFPGRTKWEEQLFAAKQVFVARGRDVMKKANQLEASAKNVPDIQNPDDPRAKDLNNRLQQLVQEAARSSADFQSVIAEGKDLASQAVPH